MTRRAYGTGSITRRGSKYLAQYHVGTDPATGSRKLRSKTFTSQRAAERWLREEVNAREIPVAGASVAQLLTSWLGEQEYRRDVVGKLSANTVSWYRSAVERHIAPTPLGSMRAERVRVDDVAAFLSSKAEAGRLDGTGGLSPSSVRRLHVVLNAAFLWAIDAGWLVSNPVRRLEAPKVSSRAADRALSVGQLRRLLATASGHRLAAAFRLQAVTGCRRGELLGLRWRDVRIPDIGDATVSLSQSIVVVDGHPVTKSLKTESSVRRIPIDGDTVAALQVWRDAQAGEQEVWGEGWTDTGLVFTREDGSAVNPNWYTREFRRVVRAAGIEAATPRDLRHTAATLMLTQGVPTKVVSDLLGHSSTRVTSDVYQATVQRMGKDAIAGIGDALR